MLSILKKTYGEVFVWIQGTGDYKYLKGITDISDVHIIEPNLDAYTAVLQSGKIDYVRTRLHAGIHALNYGVRSIILAVDNRATEMGRDFHLPVIQRAWIQEQLMEKGIRIGAFEMSRVSVGTMEECQLFLQYLKEILETA